jgi:hypothetical protein
MKTELGINSVEMRDKTLSESINLPFKHKWNAKWQRNGLKSNSNYCYRCNRDLRLVLGNDWERQQQSN